MIQVKLSQLKIAGLRDLQIRWRSQHDGDRRLELPGINGILVRTGGNDRPRLKKIAFQAVDIDGRP